MIRPARRPLARLLPRGRSLPDDVWNDRHRGILVLLWLHVPGLLVFSLLRGESFEHSLVEAGIVVFLALLATWTHRDRSTSTVVTAVGLCTASAVMVHLSGGMIEMHFHYFVVVGIITLYQDWKPFLVAIGYVVVQHGVAGALAPESVYNHAAGVADPWTWAAIHGGFILAMSGAGIASWRLNETLIASVSRRQAGLTEAQEVARLGSWERDRATDRVEWSPEMFRLLQLDPATVEAGPDAFLRRVHPDDRGDLLAAIERVGRATLDHSADFRIVLDDGSVRWMNGRWRHTQVLDGVPGVAGTMQDITERKLGDAELRDALSLLSATLEATADGLLVVDNEGSIVSFNARFVEMWNVPRSILQARDDSAALAYVCSQVRDPETFVGKVRELYAQPEASSWDTLTFLDGRVFERHSRPQRVDGVVVGRVWSFRDITDQKRLENELAHQAFHDALTSLPNKALFRDRVEHALVRAARRPATLAVLFVDLDNFKTVNDSLGHTAGDELLVLVTERLLACVRDSDTVARMGGDEFAVLVEEVTDRGVVLEVAQRMVSAMTRPVHVADQEIFVSASIGVVFAGEDARVDQLLRDADLAMYTAKGKGKGRFEVYAPEMHEVAMARLEIEADLRRAIERDELVVHYQPMVELATGETLAIEALVRWNHPVRGLVPPAAFIPIAEESSLIEDIGRFVLTVACRDTRLLQATGAARPDLSVSVNLAPRHLLGGGLPADVGAALAAAGLAPEHLILELTEGAMMTDPDAAAVTLQAMKSLGVRLAVDDFGTGYSSLSYLQRFPIDIVKIDQSFVENVAIPGSESLAPAIVRMAQSLSLVTVAEGVECEPQGARLLELGCDLAQGFHLARPLPVELLVGHLLGPATQELAPFEQNPPEATSLGEPDAVEAMVAGAQ